MYICDYQVVIIYSIKMKVFTPFQPVLQSEVKNNGSNHLATSVVANSINESAFIAAPIELYSAKYYWTCALGGTAACGFTHALVC